MNSGQWARLISTLAKIFIIGGSGAAGAADVVDPIVAGAGVLGGILATIGDVVKARAVEKDRL